MSRRTTPDLSPVREGARRVRDGYDDDRDRRLPSYLGALSAYGALVTGLSALVARRGALPERVDGRDLALVGVATHKLSRLLSKNTVTSPLRAPFTEFERHAEASEVQERPRGHGVQHTVGELVSCPFCTAQWVATAFCFGLVLAPRPTRFAATLFTTVSISDALQFAFARAQQAA